MASMVDDDRSEIEQDYWQTDEFNNMEIDNIQKKKISSTISSYSGKKNYLHCKCHYSETKSNANIFIGTSRISS